MKTLPPFIILLLVFLSGCGRSSSRPASHQSEISNSPSPSGSQQNESKGGVLSDTKSLSKPNPCDTLDQQDFDKPVLETQAEKTSQSRAFSRFASSIKSSVEMRKWFVRAEDLQQSDYSPGKIRVMASDTFGASSLELRKEKTLLLLTTWKQHYAQEKGQNTAFVRVVDGTGKSLSWSDTCGRISLAYP